MGRAIVIPGVDWSEHNLGSVLPSSAIPVEALSIKGPSAFLSSAKYRVKFYPYFTNERSVTWSIVDGSSYASIDQNGNVTALSGASGDSVTIRATSTANGEVYAEKTISVTFGTIVYYDYIESDGVGYIVTPSLHLAYEGSQYGGVMTVKGTIGATNNYLCSAQYQSNSSQGRMAAYNNSNGAGAALVGSLGFSALTFSRTADTVYRYEFGFSSAANATDGYCTAYKDSDNSVLGQATGAYMIATGCFSVFASGYGHEIEDFVIGSHGACKFIRATLVKAGVTLLDYRPCTVDGDPAIFDEVSRMAYFNSDSSGLSVGNFV